MQLVANFIHQAGFAH